MSTDVHLYIATCRQCTVNKRSARTLHAPLQNYQAGNPDKRVHLDMSGPFCERHQGNKYVLMIIDQFTWWLEKVLLPVQDAESVDKAFFEYYIVCFGVPWCVHTNQGMNFDSKLFKTFCELLEAVKIWTTLYPPCSNVQVKGYNQLVLNFLQCFLGTQQKEWDTYLPPLGMSVWSMVNRNTGFMLNLIQLGWEVNIPADIMLGVPVSKEPQQRICQTADRAFRRGVCWSLQELQRGTGMTEVLLWC